MVTISCNDEGWGFKLFHHLNQRTEIELGDLELAVHGHFCHGLAQDRGMHTYYNPTRRAMYFFQLPPNLDR